MSRREVRNIIHFMGWKVTEAHGGESSQTFPKDDKTKIIVQ